MDAKGKAGSDTEEWKTALRRAVLSWRELLEELAALHDALYATVSSPGALGTVVNWQQHILPNVVHRSRQRMEALLSEVLPEDLRPPTRYAGPPRLIIPTVRTSVAASESLTLRMLWLDDAAPQDPAVFLRAAGEAHFRRIPCSHVARGVYEAALPPAPRDATLLEYYVRATPAEGRPLIFPPAAPRLNQTLVVLPPASMEE